MGTQSKIEWTESTWNPVTGCNKISPGCKNCYAERMAMRLKAMKQQNYKRGFDVTLHEESLKLPLTWKKPKVIFVNSMSDLFHEDISEEFILRVFKIMQKAKWHQFQVLTKRSERLVELSPFISWEPNIWMGVSVENEQFTYRINDLRKTHANIKFISFEPLLGQVNKLNLNNIGWVIVGGESGPKARPMKESWVVDIRDQCLNNKIPFFFKQWGGINKKKAGRELGGRTWNGLPKQKEHFFSS